MSEEHSSVSLEMLKTRLTSAEADVLTALSKRTLAAQHLRTAMMGDGNQLAMTILGCLERLAEQSRTHDPAELKLRWGIEFQLEMLQVGLERVLVSGSEPLRIFDTARSIFGLQIPMSFEADMRDTLTACAEDEATVGVLGWMTLAGSGQWWPSLNESRYHNLRIIGGWPVFGAEAPYAAVVTKGPLSLAGCDKTILIAHDDHLRLKKIMAEVELNPTEYSRARSLVLFELPMSIAENDPRLKEARSLGLDGLRVVGRLPKMNLTSQQDNRAAAGNQ